MKPESKNKNIFHTCHLLDKQETNSKSNMSTENIIPGSCLCGQIRYQAVGDPFARIICHCGNCRKVTGASFMANSFYMKPVSNYQFFQLYGMCWEKYSKWAFSPERRCWRHSMMPRLILEMFCTDPFALNADRLFLPSGVLMGLRDLVWLCLPGQWTLLVDRSGFLWERCSVRIGLHGCLILRRRTRCIRCLRSSGILGPSLESRFKLVRSWGYVCVVEY